MGIKRLSLVVLLAVMLVSSVSAQSDVIKVGKVKSTKIQTPEYKMDRNVSSPNIARGRRNWVEISLLYETAPQWLDKLTVNYFVLFDDKESKPPYQMLTLSVPYGLVAKGKHASVAYIPPAVTDRYGTPKDIYVEIVSSIAGRNVNVATERKPPRWKPLTPVSGLLMNRLNSPFAWVNSDDYELINSNYAK